ncbi:unnamed protein product [Brugia timori]|uniref:Cation transporter n=1 Tax=Brugia timori TaxID=42155 RepID=A0A0R3QTX9_9BILA|nr:unnamed protein product [Brugia timori]
MASFGCAQPGHLRSLRSCLSTTLRDSCDFSPRTGDSMQAQQSDNPSSEHHCEHIAAGCEGIVHTVAVHYAHAQADDVTTKVASIEGANGVTHYYLSQ